MKSIKELIEELAEQPRNREFSYGKIIESLEKAQEYHEEQIEKLDLKWLNELLPNQLDVSLKEKNKEIEELKYALKSQCDLASIHIKRGNEWQNKCEELSKQFSDGSFHMKGACISKADVKKIIENFITKYKGTTLSKYNCNELKRELGISEDKSKEVKSCTEESCLFYKNLKSAQRWHKEHHDAVKS